MTAKLSRSLSAYALALSGREGGRERREGGRGRGREGGREGGRGEKGEGEGEGGREMEGGREEGREGGREEGRKGGSEGVREGKEGVVNKCLKFLKYIPSCHGWTPCNNHCIPIISNLNHTKKHHQHNFQFLKRTQHPLVF